MFFILFVFCLPSETRLRLKDCQRIEMDAVGCCGNNYLKMTGKFFENNRLVNIQYKHNVRIHVESVIGLLLRKFHIFDGVFQLNC